MRAIIDWIDLETDPQFLKGEVLKMSLFNNYKEKNTSSTNFKEENWWKQFDY